MGIKTGSGILTQAYLSTESVVLFSHCVVLGPLNVRTNGSLTSVACQFITAF